MRRTLPLTPPVVGVLIAVAALLVLGAGWFAVVAPQRHHAAAAADQVDQTQAQITQLEEEIAGSGAVPAKQQVIRTADLYRITKAMPSSEDQPDLLLQLDQVARAAGVSVLTITPQQSRAAGTYTTVPIDLTVTGDFYSLTDLLYRLRALVAVRHGALDATGRLFAVSTLALTPTGKGRTLSASLTVDAYVYGTSVAPTASTASSTTSTSTTSTSSTSTTSTTTTAGATTTGESG